MKVGDLVKPIENGDHSPASAPIVEEDWVGLIIGFTGDYYGPRRQLIEKGTKPIVYWNPEFNSEVEYPDQIEVINASR